MTLALFISVHQAVAQVSFTLTSSPSVGSTPESVVAADINNDGKVDLISANLSDSTLTVLTNNGNGIFGSNATYSVGSGLNGPTSVAAADVNNDGKLDLICANFGNQNTLTVLTNNGRGGFVIASSLIVGSAPQSLAAVDVNGDGKVDLISANEDDGEDSLTVLTNNSNGGFGSNATLNVGYNPQSVVAADVNNDGKPDLISANYGDDTLTVLTNNGRGGFVIASTLNVGNRPASVVAADVNWDGKIDLICANSGGSFGNTLTVLTNNGGGDFVIASSPIVGTQPQLIMAADINGDGKVDLISANAWDGTLTVLTNDGTGGFATATTLNVGGAPLSVTAADVNSDGKLDLICANANDNTLSVLFSTPTFLPLSSAPLLGIAPAGNQSVLYWTAIAKGYTLQSTTNLCPPSWVTVSNGTPIVGVTLTNYLPQDFFRLQSP